MAQGPNTILLKGKHANRYQEKKASVAITPGMLIEVTSTDTVKPHATAGGPAQKFFAHEAYFTGGGYPGGVYTGGTIDDVYAINDLVRYHEGTPTDVIYALLKGGEVIVEGDRLTSAGDGTLKKVVTTDVEVARAVEAVDLTALPAGRIRVHL